MGGTENNRPLLDYHSNSRLNWSCEFEDPMSMTKNISQSIAVPVTTKVESLVLGLGATGLSVARYLKRNTIDARYFDSRSEPPGLDELRKLVPDAEIILGGSIDIVLKNINRIIVSPGIADSEPILKVARESGIEIVSDIELFVREAPAPIVAITGSNGKSTVTTLLSHMCDCLLYTSPSPRD